MRTFLVILFAALALPAADSKAPRHITVRFEPSKLEGYTQVFGWLAGNFPHFSDGEAQAPVSMSDRDVSANIALERDGILADSLIAYVYRPGCRVAIYKIEDPKNPPLPIDFHCEPTESVRVAAVIANAQGLPLGEMLGLIRYTGTRITEHAHESVTISLPNLAVPEGGVFTLELPDFGHDPNLMTTLVDSSFEIELYQGSQLHLGRLLMREKPEPLPLHVSATYPDRLAFTLVPPR